VDDISLLHKILSCLVVAVDGKTSSFIESNIVAIDNSATPHLHQSQLHAVEKDVSIIESGQSGDWMGCIVKKTGMPRVLLTFTILLSATMMIWLCISSAVTAPDQRVASTEPQVSAYNYANDDVVVNKI